MHHMWWRLQLDCIPCHVFTCIPSHIIMTNKPNMAGYAHCCLVCMYCVISILVTITRNQSIILRSELSTLYIHDNRPAPQWIISNKCCAIQLQLLQWRHNERDAVSNHQPHDCLLKRLFRQWSKIISKLRVTGLCAGNSPVTGEFPAHRARNAENASIWWRHHG